MHRLDRRLAALEQQRKPATGRSLSDFYADLEANPDFMADLYRGFIETGAVHSNQSEPVSRTDAERTYHQIMG